MRKAALTQNSVGDEVDIAEIDMRELSALMPHPAPESNKYTRGKLTVIGGSRLYRGAICLSGAAALRMGSGYAHVFCSSEAIDSVIGFEPSIIAEPWENFDIEAAGICEASEGHPQAVLVGCGMAATSTFERKLTLEVISACRVPLVIDGGAISILSSDSSAIELAESCSKKGCELVLTPHFGEAIRLAKAAGVEFPRVDGSAFDAEVQAVFSRFAYDLARIYKATVVLKGPTTYIASAYECCDIENLAFMSSGDVENGNSPKVLAMREGTPALAKAGTGDVLAGIIGSLISQGIRPVQASALGSVIHAFSAHAAAERLTDISVTAKDVIFCIPDAIRRLESHLEDS